MAKVIYAWERRTYVIINKTKVLLSDIDDMRHVIINKTKVLLSQT
jgi:hypothetical protein